MAFPPVINKLELPITQKWQASLCNSGVWVLAGDETNTKLLVSPDGSEGSWVQKSSTNGFNYCSFRGGATNGGSTLVLTGKDITGGTQECGIFSADNGVTWAKCSMGQGAMYYDVTYGAGYFVAGADNGLNRIHRSTVAGLTSWGTAGASPTPGSLAIFRSIAMTTPANGFLCFTNDGAGKVQWAFSTPNGTFWSAFATISNSFFGVQHVCSKGNRIIVLGVDSLNAPAYAYTDNDGTTWIYGGPFSLTGVTQLNVITSCADGFIAAGSIEKMIYSATGAIGSWASVNLPDYPAGAGFYTAKGVGSKAIFPLWGYNAYYAYGLIGAEKVSPFFHFTF